MPATTMTKALVATANNAPKKIAAVKNPYFREKLMYVECGSSNVLAALILPNQWISLYAAFHSSSRPLVRSSLSNFISDFAKNNSYNKGPEINIIRYTKILVTKVLDTHQRATVKFVATLERIQAVTAKNPTPIEIRRHPIEVLEKVVAAIENKLIAQKIPKPVSSFDLKFLTDVMQANRAPNATHRPNALGLVNTPEYLINFGGSKAKLKQSTRTDGNNNM